MINIKTILLTVLVFSLMGCSTLGGGSKKSKQAAEINTKLALAYMRNGNLNAAKEKLDRAMSYDSGYADAHHAYALFYERTGNKEAAARSFKKAMRLDKKNPEIVNNYGGFLCRHGQVAEAEQQFLSAAANPLYKTPEFAYTNAGVCVLSRGDVGRATVYLQKALSANPLFPNALMQMAEIEMKQGNAMRAHQRMVEYHKRAQGTSSSLYLAVQTARASGQFEDAQRYGLLLKAKYPNSKQAKEVYF